MIDPAEAASYVLAHCPPIEPVAVDARAASGRVLGAAVFAAEDVPPFANTAVDGYAVRAADVAAPPVVLDVIDEVAAGACSAMTVGPGQAIRVMTGAPMPAGADAAVMVEDTERLDDGRAVRVLRSVAAGAAIRLAGDDVVAGQQVLAAGTVVSPAVAGLLASVNARTVVVHRAVRVAVLSTGDELVDDGSPLGPGQIRESNRTMLVQAVAGCAAEPVDLGIVADDESTLAAVLTEAALSCDAIVTSGGVSMGDYDVVKAVLGQIAEMRWMQIAIKPAKPFAFGVLGPHRIPVFGLPGNPVSSLVSFELFARPALRQMMGYPDIHRPTVAAVCDQPIRRRADGKTHYVRVLAAFGDDGRVHVTPVAAQGSHQLAATALANGIAVVADGDGCAVGSEVPTMLLSIA